MFKSKGLILSLVAVLALLLTACSSSGNKIQGGSKNMLTKLAALKQDVSKQDGAQAQQHFNEAHDEWAKFEDDLKAKDNGLYDKIEDPLGTVKAAVKEAKPDWKLIEAEVKKLEDLLTPLMK